MKHIIRFFLLFIVFGILVTCKKDELKPEPVPESSGTFVDTRDNHEYEWVGIGDQIWMAENLAYDAGSGCYAYDNNESYVENYGRLYTWETAMNSSASSNSNPSGVQGVCPDGWHLPSDAEWEELAQYVNDMKGPYSKSNDDWEEVGKHLKATSGWNSNETDDFGFSALPGGYRYNTGDFTSIGYYGLWWSSTEYGSDHAWTRHLAYNTTIFKRYDGFKDYGFCIRCVKD